jgi:hypothetical protein
MLNLDAFKSSYPHIVKVMQEAHKKPRDLDQDYKIGLSYIINGVEKA